MTRKKGERIHIGDDIIVEVVEIDRGRVRIGITADKNVKIWREEIYDTLEKGDKRAASD